MKKLIRDAILFSACSLALSACNEEAKETPVNKVEVNKEHEHTKTVISEKKESFNKYCPVTGGTITPEALKGETAEYKGKTYAFCCAGCIKSFKENPEKLSANLSEDGQKWVSESKRQEM
jgi:YHS domain-containing protein